MRKRLFSILLALCMVLCLVPTTAFAEGETKETPVCTCETACAAEAMNAECSVCGAEGALAENCGKYAPEESGQTGTSNGEPGAAFTLQASASHSHCICGGSGTAGDHTSHSDVTYQPWNGTSSIT